MTIELKAPTLPESVPDGTIAAWHRKAGEAVARDEVLAEIETDKVVIEVPAPADGVLKEIYKHAGDTIVGDEAIGRIEPGPAPAEAEEAEDTAQAPPAGPAARRLLAEHKLDPNAVGGSGKGGRITRGDVLDKLAESNAPTPGPGDASAPRAAEQRQRMQDQGFGGERKEERVPMSRLRARVAQRLLDATNTTAMLTTFNEVNMAPVMAIRARHQQRFRDTHDGVKLGLMSFFVRASVEALKRFPAVNASIDGNDIVYHGYQDIGVAVASPRGLVVPVLRDADHMGFAEIERQILQFGEKARDGKLAIEELAGGTFTISNGGVFGSLLSTPILNPPQTAILGMHKIQRRPVVEGEGDEISILPMMYLALSYDHRLIDGKEAVQFLVTIKELLEDPTRLVLEI